MVSDQDKNKFIKCLEEITALLIKTDPAGLMSGCPEDEYDPEACRILVTITKFKLKEEVIREISRDFKDFWIVAHKAALSTSRWSISS